jgi:hypothetical protein
MGITSGLERNPLQGIPGSREWTRARAQRLFSPECDRAPVLRTSNELPALVIKHSQANATMYVGPNLPLDR